MNSKYTISAIPQNLSKEETIVQIVDVLDQLTEITKDVLSRVDKRIQTNHTKLSNISNRIDVAASKIKQLNGAKKATTVFSSSKYPGLDVKCDYESIFSGGSDIKLQKHNVKHTAYSSAYEPLNKLQFFHVEVPDERDDSVLEGLGNLPPNITGVCDLLLFNTGKNVYKEFGYIDSLKGNEVVSETVHINTSELGPAPHSISQRSSSLHQGIEESYFYKPKVEELPALDVPLDLPDLPGVAGDLRYELDVDTSIAPSAFNQNKVTADTLDLPSVFEVKDNVDAVLSNPPPPPPPPENVPKPPPIQEPPPRVVDVKVTSSEDPTNNITTTPVPIAAPRDIPPPPPLVPAPVQPPPITAPPIPDSRTNLMEAIRQAGGSQGAKLRKTNSDQHQSASTKSTAPSGDLMADLHSKLMLRRKGISGTKKSEEVLSGESTLAKISFMIPPPDPKEDNESNEGSSNEGDWDD